MSTLSVTSRAYVTIIDYPSSDKVKSVPVTSLCGYHHVYDWYGKTRVIRVEKAKDKERLIGVSAIAHGDVELFGENHTILCKKARKGEWKRIPLKDITEPVFVQLPQKKLIRLPFFDDLDNDKKSLFVTVNKVVDFIPTMRQLSFCGVTAYPRKNELKVDIDRSRPACFSAKLLSGALLDSTYEVLGDLVGTGIVMTTQMYGQDYVDLALKSTIIHEGAVVFNNIALMVPKVLEKEDEVYHITLEDSQTPVELSWFHS